MEMRGLSKKFINSPLWKLHVYLLSPVIFSVVDDPGRRVLEIGSGVGYTTGRILKRYQNASVSALDYDRDMIEILVRRLKPTHGTRVAAFTGDAKHLPFPDESFDSVFAFEVLHHIAEWSEVLCDVYRVLKRGGCIFIWDWDKKVEGNFLMRWLDKPESLFSKKEIAEGLTRAGFRVEVVKSSLPLAINIRARKA